jgi:hypothetical protein
MRPVGFLILAAMTASGRIIMSPTCIIAVVRKSFTIWCSAVGAAGTAARFLVDFLAM